MKLTLPGFYLGGGGHSPPLLDVCPPPLEILLYIYCIVQHVALAPPGMRKQLFCPPLSKILNAALTALCFVANFLGGSDAMDHWCRIPKYARVNTIKTSVDCLIQELEQERFVRKSLGDISGCSCFEAQSTSIGESAFDRSEGAILYVVNQQSEVISCNYL